MLRNDKHTRLLDAIIATLKAEFQGKFPYHDITYQIAAPKVLDHIENEIKGALEWKLLTPTQRDIIDQASDDNLTQMALRMAGSLNIVAGAPLNFVLGNGLDPNALAKVYFDFLDIKVSSFANDLTLKSKKKNGAIVEPGQPPIFFPASHEELKGDFFKDRRRLIQLEFCLGLLASATPAQIQTLQTEAAMPRSYGMLNMIAGHQNFLRRFQSNPLDTASMDIYKKTLEQIGNIHQQAKKL